MSVPPVIEELVERFQLNQAAYRVGQYNEAQVRQEFINPFWEALGWDVYNKQGYSEKYKEVVHEASLKIQGKSKAPDYAFRLGGQRVFFVEAKKPAVKIKEEIPPAYQLRRYAWSANLPLSVLTDFEEFAVYDCRIKPVKTDKASTARVMYLTYKDYPARWDEIADIFSSEAIRKGAFDRYVESKKAKRGTAEVDAAFLQEIEGWRETLARNIALRNPGLSVRELNRAVQMTIDRLIFLRICEDRGIEPYQRLGSVIQEGKGVYARLGFLFQQADERYNSGLFHFQEEKGRDDPADNFTLNLQIDDRVLKDIVGGLYYPDCPYEFSVLPADILGQVYEQFLGKVIRLTAGGRARVEEKPEVKKAGGVYYTPTYIVDYIVKHTVGKLLEGKTPRQVWGSQRFAPLRILDPACGSGTFLLQAYQYLLDWYLERYVEDDPEMHARQGRLAPTSDGDWRLTTEERKRILLTHIHGVDIDPQAVEVTKLSLLLKVLEEEQGVEQLVLFGQERALPDLAQNIRCGNSLIGPDYYEGQQLALFDEEEMYRVNAFDWKQGFPRAMAAGGFDAVIGNPPYIRIQAMKQWAPQEVEFYKKQYIAASKGNYDIYVVFVEKGLSLLNRNGRLGYILPSKFFTTNYGVSLRTLLAEAEAVDQVVDFGYSQVFERSTTYTCLLFLDKSRSKEIEYAQMHPGNLSAVPERAKRIPSGSLGSGTWLFLGREEQDLLDRIARMGLPLLELPAMMSRGTSTGADHVFCLKENNGPLFTRNGEMVDVETDILRQPLYATDFTRYHFHIQNHERIIFPYIVRPDGYELIEAKTLRAKWPRAYDYLRSRKTELESRRQYKEWYGYSAPRNLNIHDRADLLVPLLADRGLFAPAPQSRESFCVMASAGFSVSLVNLGSRLSPLYVLGLVNSKLLFWNLRLISNKFRGGWITCTKQYFGSLSIRTVDFGDSTDVAKRDKMVGLVEQMLALHKKLARVKTPQAKRLLEQQIEIVDREIDRLVYDLYELTEEEIAIVEEAK